MASKQIVAFMLRDHFEGEGDDEVIFKEGQRVELEPGVFRKMAKDGLCGKGVYVKMIAAVEGGRYSLKPHDKTWLQRHVYDAWKTAGICEQSKDDPDTAATLKARAEAVAEAIKERDAAIVAFSGLEGAVKEASLIMAAAQAQAEKVRIMIAPEPDSGNVLDDEGVALLSEVMALIGILPDRVVEADPETVQST